MNNLYIFFIVLTIIICLCLAFMVLVQNPKGGGLDASFGGVSNNTFGAQRTSDFLEKGTWYLAVGLLVVSLAASLYVRSQSGGSTVKTQTEGVDPITRPAAPEGTNLLPTQVPTSDPAPATDPAPADPDN